MVISDAVVAAVWIQRVGKRILPFLFRRGEYRRRLVRLRCRGFPHHVRLLHVSADIVDGFLSENGKARPAFKGHIPQRYILRMIVYAVHFKLPPIYGQTCADGNIANGSACVCLQLRRLPRDRSHCIRRGLRCCGLLRRFYKLCIMPVVEQTKSAVHISGKLLSCVADGIIGTVTLVRPIQP